MGKFLETSHTVMGKGIRLLLQGQDDQRPLYYPSWVRASSNVSKRPGMVGDQIAGSRPSPPGHKPPVVDNILTTPFHSLAIVLL